MFCAIGLVVSVLLAAARPTLAASRPVEVAFSRDTDFVDRLHTDSSESAALSMAIFDTLLYRDPESGELQGLLASEWRWSADKRAIDFELRRGVRFHDGESFDADDVVYTLSLAMNPRSGLRQREASFGFLKAVEKTGAYSVRVHLREASATAEDVFASRLVMLPQSYGERHGGHSIHRTAPVGTGPFEVAKLVAGSEIVLGANPHYFRGPKPAARSESIRIRFMPDAQTQLAELLSGSLDFAWDLPVNQAAMLTRDSRFVVGYAAGARLLFLSLDSAGRSGESPLRDRRVRQAIALAIDRSKIAAALGGSGSIPLVYQCHPLQMHCPSGDTAVVPTAPARARQLLAAAGYSSGFALELEFGSPRLRPVAEALQWQLRQVAIEVTVRQFTLPAWRRRFLSGASRASLVAYGGDLLHVAHTLPVFFDLGANDYVRDSALATVLRKAAQTPTADESRELYGDALRRIRAESYTVPIHAVVVNFVHRRDLCHRPGKRPLPNLMTIGACTNGGT